MTAGHIRVGVIYEPSGDDYTEFDCNVFCEYLVQFRGVQSSMRIALRGVDTDAAWHSGFTGCASWDPDGPERLSLADSAGAGTQPRVEVTVRELTPDEYPRLRLPR